MARLLFVKTALEWPRVSGHDVYGFHLMRVLGNQGHEVSLITRHEPSDSAIAGLALVNRSVVPNGSPNGGWPGLNYWQARFGSFYGVDGATIAHVASTARTQRADAVVAVGLDALPFLGGVQDAVRVWYAADEWVRHHLTQIALHVPRTWSNLRDAVIKGAYERSFASLVDRVWVVTEDERRAMRWFAGMRHADIVACGVDGRYFQQTTERPIAHSAVFWGRLDFGPNVQALEWFCRRIWPGVRARVPDATFTIVGFKPSEDVKALERIPGVVLVPDLEDLRAEVSRHAVVVLPFVSGGGIKNKLLEAASLGKPIVSTPRSCAGLNAPDGVPVLQARTVGDWIAALVQLWGDERRQAALGASAREWVSRYHTWEAAASHAMAGIEAARAAR